MRFGMGVVLVLLAVVGNARAQDKALAGDIAAVLKQGTGTAAGRAAWERLAGCGPEALPVLLEALKGATTAQANWLRTAFDRIADAALAKGTVPAETLLAFVQDPGKPGRARRLALELVEKVRPGTSVRLFAGWAEDPEFRFEGVDHLLDKAQALVKAGNKDAALGTWRAAFEASRDVMQGRKAAAGLEELGVKVSVARNLGFLTDWYLIGAFDARGKKGFTLSYPPEKAVDLKAEYAGKYKKIRWVRHKVEEAPPRSTAKHQALIDLIPPLGNADDAVAFAYTEIDVPAGVTVEFRGAADDNFTVWVNGKRVFGFEEYDNGVRFDRHRFPARLRAGKNTILVKIIQAVPPNPGSNWEFFLRIVDKTGKGIAMKDALP